MYSLTNSKALVRNGRYQSLDLTIEEALNLRQPDFPGVVICTAGDSLGTLMQLIKKRRVHRLVVVEGDVSGSPYIACAIAYVAPLRCRKRRSEGARKAGCWESSRSATFSGISSAKQPSGRPPNSALAGCPNLRDGHHRRVLDQFMSLQRIHRHLRISRRLQSPLPPPLRPRHQKQQRQRGLPMPPSPSPQNRPRAEAYCRVYDCVALSSV